MKLSRQGDDEIVTHALGSCLGVAVYDPQVPVGGILHVMLPEGRANRDKAAANPYMFVDTGVPAFFRQLYDAGGVKSRMVVKVAGGANINNVHNDRFRIGKRNYVVLRKLLWKNSVLIDAEDTGGSSARTMYLDVGTGQVWVSTGGTRKQL
jgi:chemotaxis protein CheD